MNKVLKPNFNSFFWLGVAATAVAIFVPVLGLFVAAIVSGDFGYLISMAGLGFFGLVSLGIQAIGRYIMYQKEEYEILPDKIIVRRGGIFFSSSTELRIKNITDVEQIYPFISYSLFKTGKIKVESAGSSTTEVYLKDLDNAKEVTAQIEDAMQNQGFNLSTNKLIYKSKPSLIGVAIEGIGLIISSLIAVFVFGSSILADLSIRINQTVLLLAIPVVIFAIIVVILRVVDIQRREYSVYSGVLRYEEGFLTKRYAIIPAQNLSDVSLNQDVVRRIFGIANVVLSTKGVANNIQFRNIPDAAALEKSIEETIAQQRPFKKTNALRRNYTDFGTSYKMDARYVFLSPLIGLPVVVSVFFVAATVFAVGANVFAIILFLTVISYIGQIRVSTR